MAQRDEIVSFLDRTLDIESVPDPYCPNGLQIEGTSQVTKIGLAVDACLESFRALSDCQLILTHHGLFWPSIKSLTGPLRRSIGFLIERDINLYSAHLPLDVHDVYGNNAVLLKALGWMPQERFDQVGWIAQGPASPLTSVAQDLDKLLENPGRLLAFGPSQVKRLAVSSGGGSIGLLANAKAAGADLLITGEATHPIYHAAQEMGMNLILAGHYLTETWGVKALGPLLEKAFDVSTRFIDLPTGL